MFYTTFLVLAFIVKLRKAPQDLVNYIYIYIDDFRIFEVLESPYRDLIDYLQTKRNHIFMRSYVHCMVFILVSTN